jgi:hypothetical protein
MLRRIPFLFAAFGALQAQQVVAPTTEQVGSPRGTNTGDYNITQSFETGYRFSLVGGDLGEYRTDVNYGNGIRLLGSSLTVNSRDGHGRFFDEIVLNTIGLGNDPYQSAILRVQKNQLYRYDMTWRLSDYYNPGLTVAGGTHFENTSRRLQDHELTLLPQSAIQFHVGYARNTENGPALSTAQEFDANGTGFPVFTNVRREWNEYRLGAEANFAGVKFIVSRRWDFFKDDTPATNYGVQAAGTPRDLTVLNQFSRSAPIHGDSDGWLGNLFTRHKYWGVNARLTYTDGRNDFALVELASGLSQFGGAASRQILVGGNASRPDLAADFAISLFPTDNLTFVNNTSVSNNRIDGLSNYTEYFSGFNLGTTVYFRYLATRIITNSADLNYRAFKWLGFYGGYHYSDRQVRTTEAFSLPAFAGAGENDSYSVTNQLQSGLVGIRLRPIKPLTINLDGEIGRNTTPLTPIADGKYHTLGGRIDYRTPKLQLSTGYREYYNHNLNQGFFSIYGSHSRTYTTNASWTPRNWLSLDASYVKMHQDSDSFLAFFAGGPSPVFKYPSLYISNIHSVNFGSHVVLGKRADLYVGYSIVKDLGDGRATAVDPAVASDPVQSLLSGVQTFPLSYQSPLARVSIRITPKIRWNAGWQFYNYNEKFGLFGYYQNFHAQTGFTSVLWSF